MPILSDAFSRKFAISVHTASSSWMSYCVCCMLCIWEHVKLFCEAIISWFGIVTVNHHWVRITDITCVARRESNVLWLGLGISFLPNI